MSSSSSNTITSGSSITLLCAAASLEDDTTWFGDIEEDVGLGMFNIGTVGLLEEGPLRS